MQNMKCIIKPVIIGVTGIETNFLKKNLETIPVQHSVDSLKRQLYYEHQRQCGKYCSLPLKLDWIVSPLVQEEKFRDERDCDKIHNNNNNNNNSEFPEQSIRNSHRITGMGHPRKCGPFPARNNKVLFSPNPPDWLWGPQPPIQWVLCAFSSGWFTVQFHNTVILCIFIVRVYVFFLLSMYSYCLSMYSYCCLCILIVVYVFLLFVHVVLSLSMYTYCCLCILRRCYPDRGFSVLFPRL